MRAACIIVVLLVLGSAQGPVWAGPPGSCEPWPDCKGDDGGSEDGAVFSENCRTLDQWDVTGNWTTSHGECVAKNTDGAHAMVTAGTIDLSGAAEAQLSYKYRIDNADEGEYMRISASSDGGNTFTDLFEYVGSESGTVSLDLAGHIALTDSVKLRASCMVSANNEVCGWDNIKIETLASPPDGLVVTINVPQPRIYGSNDFPLTYEVTLSRSGTASYILDGGLPVPMAGDEGGFTGTLFTAVEPSLSDGDHSFQVSAMDDQGNINETQIVTFTVDTLAPGIAFVDPTPPDGSSQDGTDISVNLATTSGSDHYAFVDFDRDLHLWLRMEETIGDYVSDSSSYANDGLAEGDAFQNPNGRFGSAFEFDGINHGGGTPTDRIVIPGFQDRHPIFDGPFTVMAWAKPDVNEKMVIVGTKSITNLPGWHLRTSGGSHRLRMGVNTGYTNETAAYAEARFPMEAGVWVHVVGTYDPDIPAIQLYLDGELIDTTTGGVSALGYGNTLDLAVAVPEDPQKAWDGLVDEVMIFNRVLEAGEIKDLYDAAANQFLKTYSGLGSGPHTFIGRSVNQAGNMEETEARSVTVN